MNGLSLFYWDTEIGQMMALATDVAQARELIMNTLSKKDLARPELQEAISVEPEVITSPKAIVAYIN